MADFWDVMSCMLVEVSWFFRSSWCLHQLGHCCTPWWWRLCDPL